MPWTNDVEENLKVGLVDILILHLLSEEDMYGYQIRQEILKRSDNKIDLKEGSLYGPFYRLEKKGFINSYKTLVTGKRFRIYYSITDLGKQYYDCSLKALNNIYTGLNLLIFKEVYNHGNK